MQHPMQAHMGGAYPAHNVTTELIQKYLDENKQLILAILDNQNLGKLNECAAYQAKLQANLMYLAAIADSQPQQPSAQVPQAAMMQQPGMHYMAHQQAQQQMAAQQSFMAARNPAPYPQQSYPMLHQQQQQQQQQAMQGQHGMNMGGSSSLGGMASEQGMGGFPDFVRGHPTGNSGTPSVSRGLSGGFKSDMLSAEAAHGTQGGNGSGHDAETSYLKASEEEGN